MNNGYMKQKFKSKRNNSVQHLYFDTDIVLWVLDLHYLQPRFFKMGLARQRQDWLV